MWTAVLSQCQGHVRIQATLLLWQYSFTVCDVFEISRHRKNNGQFDSHKSWMEDEEHKKSVYSSIQMPSPTTLELEKLLFRDVNLCHQQLDEMSCPGKQNQWILRSDSRNKLLSSGEFLQIFRSHQFTYWLGNKHFLVCCNHYYWKVKNCFIICLSSFHIILFIETNLAVTDLRSCVLVTRFAYEMHQQLKPVAKIMPNCPFLPSKFLVCLLPVRSASENIHLKYLG